MNERKLTMRSKITVRWTSNPADMGYGGTPSLWEKLPGEVMSLRRALGFSDELGKRIGPNVFKRIQYSNKGRFVSLDEIREVVTDKEYELYIRGKL